MSTKMKTGGRAGGRSVAGARTAASENCGSTFGSDIADARANPDTDTTELARSGPHALSLSAIVLPERLVGFGFRGWISGYQSGDVGCWEKVWRLYDDRFGPRGAQAAVADLSSFAKSVSACSRRRLVVEPLDAGRFGRDESLAISMVAAFQHNTCPAMRACAFALVESSMLDEVLHHASSFAVTLRTLDAVVPPAWIVNANAFVGVEPLALN